MDDQAAPNPRIKRRGFGSLSQERRREIARLGGQAAARKGVGHRWTPEEAQAAGRVGGARGKRGPAKQKAS